MSELGDRLSQELEQLRTVRDELKVQLSLGRAEVRDRWEQLEERWQSAEGKLRELREESRGEIESIGDAARNLLQEIRTGYDHLKSKL